MAARQRKPAGTKKARAIAVIDHASTNPTPSVEVHYCASCQVPITSGIPVNTQHYEIHYKKRDLLTVKAWFQHTPFWRILLNVYAHRLRWQWLIALSFGLSVCLWWAGLELMKHVSIYLAVEQIVHQFWVRVASTIIDDAI